MTKQRAKMNRTITLTDSEREILRQQLLRMPIDPGIDLLNRIICADLFEAVHCIPRESVDLLFVDPPITSTKSFTTTALPKWNWTNIPSGWIPGLSSFCPP